MPEHHLPGDLKEKIALFCDIKPHEVIENISTDILYQVPLLLQQQGLDQLVIDKLSLQCSESKMSNWVELVKRSATCSIK